MRDLQWKETCDDIKYVKLNNTEKEEISRQTLKYFLTKYKWTYSMSKFYGLQPRLCLEKVYSLPNLF